MGRDVTRISNLKETLKYATHLIPIW